MSEPPDNHPPDALGRLLDIMRRLRDPVGGCPWDLQQDARSLAHYAIEEAYEVAEAIENGDPTELRDELGDLLLQIVFHSQIAAEQGFFVFDDVAEAIAAKMIRRHPHVFGSASIPDAAAQTRSWEAIKAAERQAKATAPARILDGIALSLPALIRAEKLQKRAANHGFDWPDPLPVFDKIAEEAAEIREALAIGEEQARLEEEVGDLLFSVVNLARKLSIDPERALRGANEKFRKRFTAIEETLLAQGRTPGDQTLEQLDALWNTVKRKTD